MMEETCPWPTSPCQTSLLSIAGSIACILTFCCVLSFGIYSFWPLILEHFDQLQTRLPFDSEGLEEEGRAYVIFDLVKLWRNADDKVCIERLSMRKWNHFSRRTTEAESIEGRKLFWYNIRTILLGIAPIAGVDECPLGGTTKLVIITRFQNLRTKRHNRSTNSNLRSSIRLFSAREDIYNHKIRIASREIVEEIVMSKEEKDR